MAECHKRREMPRQFSVVLRLLFEEERARHLVDQREKGREASVKGTRIKRFLPSAEDDRITVDPYSDRNLSTYRVGLLNGAEKPPLLWCLESCGKAGCKLASSSYDGQIGIEFILENKNETI